MQIFNSLKGKLIVPLVAVLIFLVIFMVLYVAMSMTALVNNFADERVSASAQAVQAYLQAHQQQTFLAASAMGSSAELVNRINSGNRDDIWQYVFERKLHFGVDEIIVASHEGITLARSHMRESYGDDVSGVPSIAAGLRGEFLRLYTPTPTAYMVMTTSAPIMDGSRLVGSVVVNYVIGDNVFIDRVKESFGTDITVFAGDTSVASTLIHPDSGERAVGTAVASDIAEIVLEQGHSIALDLNVFGRLPYKAYYFPLIGAAGNPVGIFFVGIPQAEALAAAGSSIRNLIIIGILGIIVASAVSFFVIMQMLKPLNDIMLSAKNIAEGNLNIQLDTTRKDEIGAIKREFVKSIAAVNNITYSVNEMRTMHQEKGKYEFLLDESNYSGAYKKIVTDLNSLIAMYSGDFVEILDVSRKYGAGDFTANVSVYPDSWKWANEAIDDLRANFVNMASEISTLAESAANGKLDVRADTSKYSGSWAEAINKLNDLVGAVSEPISEISSVMNQIGTNADFNTKVEGDYAGEFLAIKESVNSMIDGMNIYIPEIDKALNAIASGDLTYKASIVFDGDFNTIGKSIESITSKLHKTMSEINSASEQVLYGAKQISDSAMDLANGATEQAGSVEELTATIGIINHQTKQNADDAQEASTLSNKSTQYANEGNDAMKQMLEAMLQIKDSSSSISRIIKVIQDIAFQTNLLALNAAVEAARAGEHGKGFAVVAEEVRNLAARSQAAATETTGLIENSVNRVGTGSSIAEATAESLNSIVSSANEVLQIINNISDSSQSQTEAIEQISTGINQISQVVQNNSAVSEETAATSEELSSQAELLQQLVAYFKL